MAELIAQAKGEGKGYTSVWLLSYDDDGELVKTPEALPIDYLVLPRKESDWKWLAYHVELIGKDGVDVSAKKLSANEHQNAVDTFVMNTQHPERKQTVVESGRYKFLWNKYRLDSAPTIRDFFPGIVRLSDTWRLRK